MKAKDDGIEQTTQYHTIVKLFAKIEKLTFF